MEIYHGGYCPIEHPELIEGKYSKDFGTGFYCTELKPQAMRWASRYSTPIISTYNFVLDENLNTLIFDQMTDEWLHFIVNCRNGQKHHYDIVIGAMANDQVYNCNCSAPLRRSFHSLSLGVTKANKAHEVAQRRLLSRKGVCSVEKAFAQSKRQ